ncbi:DUF411 domain-containing protein [Leptolyngbya iicbica]|nr:DUF411 domain-containing protein [Leptolyngbya sp. LK]
MKNPLASLRFWFLSAIAAGLVVSACSMANPGGQSAIAAELTVFRSPTCGCCSLWIDHMKEAGFTVRDEVTEDMTAIKQEYGLPQNLASCHTTIANGYVIEGHIPAADVQRLLTEKPDIAGIAVPGMPIGSPGMESGNYVEPYTVFSFTDTGETAAFAEHS